MSALSAAGQDATWNSCQLLDLWWWIWAGYSSLSQFSIHFSFTGTTGAPGQERLTCSFCFLQLLLDASLTCLVSLSSSPASISCKRSEKYLQKFQIHLEQIFRPAMFQPLEWNIPAQEPFLGWFVSEISDSKFFLKFGREKNQFLFCIFLKNTIF